jgi:ketosteroid isomerase-like protein
MNIKYMLFILFVLLAQILVACGSAAPTATNPEPTTAPPVSTAMPEVLDPAAIAQEFYKATNAGDLEAAMALVAEDVKCRGACYLTGKEAFRSYIQGSINIGGGGSYVELSDLQVEDYKVTYRWEVFNKDGNFVDSGLEALQIKDGLIILMETRLQ